MMMVAMMPPSLVPMLWRYRQAIGRTGERAASKGVSWRLISTKQSDFTAP